MKIFKRLSLVLACFILSYTFLNAAIADIPFTQQSGTYSSIASTGTQLTSLTAGSLDDGYYTVSLPFNFTFNGTSYSSLYINTNGWVSPSYAATSITVYPSTGKIGRASCRERV